MDRELPANPILSPKLAQNVESGLSAAPHGAPQAYDVDGDGLLESLLNTNDGFIHHVDVVGRELEHVGTSAQPGKGNQGHPTIVDIDRDGAYEVLYASSDNNTYCLYAETGHEEWRFDMGANPHQCLVLVYDVMTVNMR
jgi:outer membrane protein assembly factor BamB